MTIIINLLIAIIAITHLYILWFEMFAWETRGRKVFRQFPAELFPKTKVLAANQGLYNGFLAAGLIWSLLISNVAWSYNVALFFLGCVFTAGLYGTFTASKKIFYVQGLPSLIAIVLIILKRWVL